MTYKVPHHIWRTTDGRLVPDGDLEAAFLAYPAGEELSDSVAASSGASEVYAEKKKAVAKPADKAMAKPADKVGAAIASEGEPQPVDEAPKGNASREDWAVYAAIKGAPNEETAEEGGLTRDDLRAKYGAQVQAGVAEGQGEA